MNPNHATPEQLEELLDGELSPAESRTLRDHVDSCAACAAELRGLERVFTIAGGPVLRDPGPALTERILDRVLPSRLRRRWVTALGWSYTAVSAACTFAVISWFSRPDTPAWVASRIGEGYIRAVQALLFSLNAIAFSWVHAITGWTAVSDFATRFEPVLRALSRPLAQPVVAGSAMAAILACAATLWWMHARRDPATRKVPHVGLLGF